MLRVQAAHVLCAFEHLFEEVQFHFRGSRRITLELFVPVVRPRQDLFLDLEEMCWEEFVWAFVENDVQAECDVEGRSCPTVLDARDASVARESKKKSKMPLRYSPAASMGT